MAKVQSCAQLLREGEGRVRELFQEREGAEAAELGDAKQQFLCHLQPPKALQGKLHQRGRVALPARG